jgi:hypothetical protein
MPTGDDYRQHAADCLRLAQVVKHPVERASLLRMAQIWRDMAVKADEAEKRKLTANA